MTAFRVMQIFARAAIVERVRVLWVRGPPEVDSSLRVVRAIPRRGRARRARALQWIRDCERAGEELRAYCAGVRRAG